ncbi:MAG TPA: PAS domain-containing sensor histidine kinase [Beijerinckiaceae bacterium]
MEERIEPSRAAEAQGPDSRSGETGAADEAGSQEANSGEARAAEAKRGWGWVGPLVVIAALWSALATFLILAGATPIAPTYQVVLSVFLLNAVLVLCLVGMVAWETRSLVRARLAGAAGARLHARIVGLFSLVAGLPTILVAIVASVTLERSLQPWFSDRMRDVIFKSVEVADAYATGQCQSLGREVRVLADDLVRARPLFDVDRHWFDNFLTSRATALGLPVTRIVKAPNEIVARASIDVLKDPPALPQATFDDAAKSADPICVVPREGRVFGAVLKLPQYDDDAYLFVAREVNPLAVEFPNIARSAAVEYLAIDSQRKGIQIAFASMFALIALIVLFSAIWFGLNFANRLVAPIRRMIHATDQVATGNFYVQVPVRKTEGDLAHLGSTFNKMTSELRRQRDGLTAASDLIDRRRRFTEAVLSGVSAAVIGVDGRGVVTIVNPSAEALLGAGHETLVGAPIAEAVPEIGPLFEELRHTRQRLAQEQIQLVRNNRERTINVRVTSEQSRGEDKGFVVTLDDITDLVAAQRTSAWADVARRIAHEIKNPLTPIQLSAERIRRKYGKVITTDREVFDQCTSTIVRQVDDIKRMVDEFSSFARMPKPTMGREDIVDTVRHALVMMRIAHPEIAFADNLPMAPIEADFDRRLMSQSVTNIVKNATEAIAAVPEEERGEGRIGVTVRREEDVVAIEVADNGKGFPAEGRQRLLEPYMTTREGGTGLGLAIVAKILEEHGGGIELRDNPAGRGGLVRMWFMARKAEAEAPSAERRASSERRRAGA